MSGLLSLIKKELRELMTPATLLPMLLIVVVFMLISPMMNISTDDTTTAGQLGKAGFVNNDSDDANSYSYLAEVTVLELYGGSDSLVTFAGGTGPSTADEIMAVMAEQDIPVLLVIEPGYSDSISNGTKGMISVYWQNSSVNSQETTVDLILYAINYATSTVLLNDQGATYGDLVFVSAPVGYSDYLIVNGSIHEGYTPSDVTYSLVMQSLLVSLMVLLIIIMMGQVLIAGMGSEKENKTLETLLTLPLSRTAVVGGKIIGSAIAGIVFGCLFLVSLMVGVGGVFSTGSVLGDLGLSLTVFDWVIVGVFLLLAIICALGMCMILGAFTKNYKAAQILIMPLAVLVIIPMVVNLFGLITDLGILNTVMFFIPFSQPTMALNNLISGDMMMIAAGLAYLAAFTAAMLYITIRLYGSDILLTGLIKKDKKTYKWINLGFSMKR